MTQYGSAMGTSMTGLSQQLAQLGTTASVTMNGSTGVFNVPSAAGTPTVFNLTTSQLAGMSAIQFNTNGSNLVVVNVTGNPVNLNQNFLGGTNNDEAMAITVDPSGSNAYVVGWTVSTNFPYINALASFGTILPASSRRNPICPLMGAVTCA